MTDSGGNSPEDRPPSSAQAPGHREGFWAFVSVTAAFGTYFCMYAFRKPFTAATYDGAMFWGVDFKTLIVSAQVIGYMLSKFIGIKVISEMAPHRRGVMIIVLIAMAELSLVLFGAIPRPWNAIGLFLNGLSLGMVFGLVLGFLEGRRLTEALTAGLCTSFILADGVTKSVGVWLLQSGIAEDWMPCVAGLLFLVPLCVSVAILSKTPSPSARDIAERSKRYTMSRAERWSLLGRYAGGLTLLVTIYLLITVIRSVRADFAPELWLGLGEDAAPSIYTQSEFLVALGVLVANGFAVYFRDNRAAFYFSLVTCGVGCLLVMFALLCQRSGVLSPFLFMVIVGLGLYLPYIAMHTTVFERLLAMTRERGNLGFLLYVADSIGYLGYVTVMMTRSYWTVEDDVLGFFVTLCWIAVGVSMICLLLTWRYFAKQRVDPSPALEVESP